MGLNLALRSANGEEVIFIHFITECGNKINNS